MKPKLVKQNCTEKQKDEWVNHPKTRNEGKWFDGFTTSIVKTKNSKPLYPNEYDPNNI